MVSFTVHILCNGSYFESRNETAGQNIVTVPLISPSEKSKRTLFTHFQVTIQSIIQFHQFQLPQQPSPDQKMEEPKELKNTFLCVNFSACRNTITLKKNESAELMQDFALCESCEKSFIDTESRSSGKKKKRTITYSDDDDDEEEDVDKFRSFDLQQSFEVPAEVRSSCSRGVCKSNAFLYFLYLSCSVAVAAMNRLT
jgi:hypothetical protein